MRYLTDFLILLASFAVWALLQHRFGLNHWWLFAVMPAVYFPLVILHYRLRYS